MGHRPVLTEEQKDWIIANSADYTAKQIAEKFGVIPQIIDSFCKHRKLPIIRRRRRDSIKEYKPTGKFFNYDSYIKTVITV